jgi:hypothetical protein
LALDNVNNTSDASKPVSAATLTALNAKEPTITVGTTSQYWRGDKSWQTLNQSAVGLGNVNNTSDASKPISTATQTALDTKLASRRIVDVESFRDGVRTDDEILAAAFSALQAGGEIRFGQGVTYTLSARFDANLSTKPGVVLNGQGATIAGPSSLGTFFVPRGSTAVATYNLTADTNRSSTVIIDNAVNTIVAGDILYIFSDEVYNIDAQETNYKGEMARVLSVSGATITLDRVTYQNYITSGQVVQAVHYKPMKNVTIKDLNVVATDSINTGSAGLYPRYFDGLTVINCQVRNFTLAGLYCTVGLDLAVIACRAYNNNYPPDPTAVNGYGLWANTVNSVRFIGCYGTHNRHTIDNHQAYDVTVSSCIADSDYSYGISTHGAYFVKMVDSTASQCGGGFRFRGSNAIIRGNYVLGLSQKAAGIKMGAGSLVTGDDSLRIAGTNLVVENNWVDISGPAWLGTDTSSGDGIHVEFSPTVNARIANNFVKGYPQRGIYLHSPWVTNVDIVGNHLDSSAQVGSRPNITVGENNGTGGYPYTVVNGLNIEQNTVIGGGAFFPQSGVYIRGGETGVGADLSDYIRVRNNNIDNCNTAAVVMPAGYFGSHVEVYDNTTYDTDLVLSTSGATFSDPPQKRSPSSRVMTGTCGTAVSTTAKTVTLDTPWTTVTPAAGDTFQIVFTNGNNTGTLTLSINGGSAIPILNMGNSASAVGLAFNAGVPYRFYYDGTTLYTNGVPPGEISTTNIVSTSSSTVGTISGRRAETLMANEATNARTLTNKILTDATNKRFMTGTCATAIGTAAKTVTLDSPWASEVLTTGQEIQIVFTNGSNTGTLTLSVNGGAAIPILNMANSTSSVVLTFTAGIPYRFYYDGTSLYTNGIPPVEITAANIINTASTAQGSISGRRAESLMANEATVVRTLTSKTLTNPKFTSYTTGGRPSASSAGATAMIYDTTLNKPVWSDGTNWRDAAGTVV